MCRYVLLTLCAVLCGVTCEISHREYLVDDSRGVGRTFDGVGAISGGGATSKLLINYPEPQRSQVLDYLFLPSFGASLDILKVEIGGDSQSTDGSESSHMHTEDDENYDRGYEWWLMKEAKKRNPHIKLYGLPWTFPGWVGSGIFDPFHNRTKPIKYILNWIMGAKRSHGLDINYIGVWNERDCDIPYIKMLRQTLDAFGLHSVQIVAPDSMTWSTVSQIQADKDLAAALDILGVHYLTVTPPEALAIDRPIWESEAFSARNDFRGGACMARILNEGYVRGFITGYIAWNLIASYYDGMPYSRSSLMTANQPWSGHYEVASPIWSTAHLTQFAKVGWNYLPVERGVGELVGNGTYISLTSPDRNQLTLVIQTMDPTDVPCFYPMPKYTILDQQNATFRLAGSFANITELKVWYSSFNIDNYVGPSKAANKKCSFRTKNNWCDTSTAELFQKLDNIKVVDGKFTLQLKKNEVYTITSLDTGQKGTFPDPVPESRPFPVPYYDNFEGYSPPEEPYNFAQQSGSFEAYQSNDLDHGKVMRQVTTDPPVDTCKPDRMPGAANLIGDFNWSDVWVDTDVYIEPPPGGASSVFLGARVKIGGCWSMYANGFYLWLFPEAKNWTLTGNFTRSVVLGGGTYDVQYNKWYNIGLNITEKKLERNTGDRNMLSVTALINHNIVHQIMMDPSAATSPHGWVGLGTGNHGTAQFDNFKIHRAKSTGNPETSRKNLEVELTKLMTKDSEKPKALLYQPKPAGKTVKSRQRLKEELIKLMTGKTNKQKTVLRQPPKSPRKNLTPKASRSKTMIQEIMGRWVKEKQESKILFM